MTNVSYFSSRLKQFRTTMGVSRLKFAEILDSAESTIYSYETSKRTPNVEFLQKLIDNYDVDISYFFKNTREHHLEGDIVHLKQVIKYLEKKLKQK